MELKEVFALEPGAGEKAPLYSMSVSAGTPVSVGSEKDEEVDINEFLVKHPAATFFAKVCGDAMADLGVRDDDLVIFDSSLEPKDGKIVVARCNEELTLKVYRVFDGEAFLQSTNNQFLPMEINPYVKFEILGLVTKVIHSL